MKYIRAQPMHKYQLPQPLVRVVDLWEINYIIQPQRFVPVPLPPSPQREVLRGGFPCCCPHSALVFSPTRAEVIFWIFWELHGFHGKLHYSLVKSLAGFSELRKRCTARKE